MRLRGWLVVGVAVTAALLLLGRAVTSLVVEHAWFIAMGVPTLWWERALDTALLRGGACVAGSAFAFVNLHAVRRTILAVAVPSRVANIELTAMIPGRRLLSATIILAIFIGIALATPLDDWTQLAMARHGIPFGEIEGFLNRDLGFYVYWVPLEESLYVWALVSVVTVGLMVMVLYALTRSLRLDGRRVVSTAHARRHISALGALVLLLLAWSYRLDGFDLLRNGSGPDGLFLRVDHVVSLRVDELMTVLCALGAVLLLRAGWMSQLRLAFITLSLVLIGAIGLRHLLPAIAARGNLLGDPQRRDRDYLETRTLVSRRAYDVDGIRFGGTDSQPRLITRIKSADLARAVSLWDGSTAQQRSTDAVRGTMVPAPTAWTTGANGTVHALIARRPISGEERWTLSLADATLPIIRDSAVVLASDSDDGAGNAMRLAVGPGLSGHALMVDPTGAVLGTTLRTIEQRIAHAWAARDPELLQIESTTEPLPVYVSQRDVRTRVALLAPVFAQGTEVSPLVHDGSLYWTVSLYSSSDSYPLSQEWQLAGEVRSYFRFAATALVEASTGRVRLVPADHLDPIARTWMTRVPSLIAHDEELPTGLIDRLPPATDAAIAQLRTFARYGSRVEGSAVRHLPDSALAGDGPPAHLLPVENGSVVAWSVPLLDAGDQLGGVMTAVGGRYRRTYWDSTTTPRPRWSTMTEHLRVALDSARAMVPDGSRREPRLRPGRLQVLPGEHGPLAVQSLLWNRADGTTVISRVAVEDGGHLAIGSTLADALRRMGSSRTIASSKSANTLLEFEPKDVATSRLYDAMRQGMRSGDWVRFGAAFDSLGKVLGRPPQ